MIAVTNISNWASPGALDRASRREIRSIKVVTEDPDRALAFYARVFGFRCEPIGPTRPRVFACSNPVRLGLLVEPLRMACSFLPPPGRWAFAVDDLEYAREQVWELGVAIARDSGEADQIYRVADAWSLFVHDPDGNEIELLEWRAAPLLRGAASTLGASKFL